MPGLTGTRTPKKTPFYKILNNRYYQRVETPKRFTVTEHMNSTHSTFYTPNMELFRRPFGVIWALLSWTLDEC